MKKIKLFGWAFLATMMCSSFSACSNETEEVLAQESEIRLTSEITSSSRAIQNLQSTQIESSTGVGVTINGAKSEHKNVKWVTESDGVLKNTSKPIYWGNQDKIEITAYHPYNEKWTEMSNDYVFSVSTDQSSAPNYLNSDLLFVNSKNVSRPTDSNPILLKFDHKLAKININLEGDNLNNPQVYICGTNITTNFDLSTGNLSDTNEPNNEEIYAGVGANTSAIIIPQEVSGKFIKVVNDDKVYYYSLTSPKTFESGNKYEFTLTIKNSILITLKEESINDWTGSEDNNETGNAEEEIVLTKSVVVEEAGTLSTLIPVHEQNTITSLTISGNLNGTDIKFLRSLAGNEDNTKYLYDLDLSDATIVSGGESYNGYDNTEDNIIGRNMFSELKFESLVLPNSITAIEEEAFYRCINLKAIDIPNSVEILEPTAFWCCAISSVVIPENLTYINGTPFPGCSLLESIVVDENNPRYDSRSNCNAIIETNLNTLISGCKNTIIPNDIIVIGPGAFAELRSLTSITLPNSVETIESIAFQNSGLTSIILPNSVKEIKEYAFDGCQELETIICECETPPTLGTYAFSSNLKTIYVPATAVDDYKSASGWSSFASIIVAKE